MPKNKHQDSDTSDSGPDDKNVVAPLKKAKTSSSGAASSEGKEPEFALDKNKLVRVRTFKGKAYVDIREYYQKDGKTLPGKKGISLNPELWRKLLEHKDDINKALANI